MSRCPGFRLSTSFCLMCNLFSHGHSTAQILSWSQSEVDCFDVLVGVSVSRMQAICFIVSYVYSFYPITNIGLPGKCLGASLRSTALVCRSLPPCLGFRLRASVCLLCVLFMHEHGTARILSWSSLRSTVSVSRSAPRCLGFRLRASAGLM